MAEVGNKTSITGMNYHWLKYQVKLNFYPALNLKAKINKGYYTVARRYEFYVRMARTIFYGETNSTKAKGGNRTLTKVTYEWFSSQ